MTLLPGRGITASLIAFLVVGAACSTGGGTSGAPLPGCNSGTKQALFWTSHTPPDTDSEQNIVNNFNKQSKTTCVKMVAVPGSETDIAKLTTAVRGGTGPDVYELDRFTVAERAAAGVLTDLSSFGAANEASNYLDFAWKEALFKGKPYALPFDTDARALFYNKDMLQNFLSTYAPTTPPLPTEQDAFLTGHIGFVVTGPWVLSWFPQYKPNLHYGITYIPVPHEGDQPATWAGGWSVVIPKGAKNS